MLTNFYNKNFLGTFIDASWYSECGVALKEQNKKTKTKIETSWYKKKFTNRN